MVLVASRRRVYAVLAVLAVLCVLTMSACGGGNDHAAQEAAEQAKLRAEQAAVEAEQEKQQRIANRRVADRVRQARTALELGSADRAQALLQEALAIEGATDTSAAQELLTELASKQIEQQLADAKEKREAGQLDEALKLAMAAEAATSNAELQASAAALRGEIEQAMRGLAVEKLLEEAQALLAASQFETAQEKLSAALKLQADHPLAGKLMLAVAVLREPQRALESLQKLSSEEFAGAAAALREGILPPSLAGDNLPGSLVEAYRTALVQQLAAAETWHADAAVRAEAQRYVQMADVLRQQMEPKLNSSPDRDLQMRVTVEPLVLQTPEEIEAARVRAEVSAARAAAKTAAGGPDTTAGVVTDLTGVLEEKPPRGELVVWVEWQLRTDEASRVMSRYARDDVAAILRALEAAELNYDVAYLLGYLPASGGQGSEAAVSAAYTQPEVAAIAWDDETKSIFLSSGMAVVRPDLW